MSQCCLQLYIDFFKNIASTNGAALITALISMAIIYAVQRWINPRFKRRFKMPLPIELIVVCTQKCSMFIFYNLNIFYYSVVTITILLLSGLCPGQLGWTGARRNIHSLTSCSSIIPYLLPPSIYNPWHPPCSTYVPDHLFPQSLSKFSLVYLLAWHPPLHTAYISSPNQCLLFTAHAHTIATCFAVVPKLCHLILVSQPFTWNSIL